MQDVLLLRHSDTGNPRGAFIEFSGADELEKALEYDTEVGRPADDSSRVASLRTPSLRACPQCLFRRLPLKGWMCGHFLASVLGVSD